MRPRLLALSAGIHGLAAGLFVIGGVAGHAIGDDPASRRIEIPIEIVAPPASPPPAPAVAVAPSAPEVAPAPTPRRIVPRAPARSVVPPAGAPSPAGGSADATPPGDAPGHPSEEPAGDGTGTGTGAGSGAGSGDSGAGGGGGGGGPGIDLSRRAVPINAATSRVMPYTADALRKRITGDVRLVLHVDAQGAVVNTTFRQRLGHGLDEIAAAAARKIRFHPARDPLGRPTEGRVLWKFHFTPP